MSGGCTYSDFYWVLYRIEAEEASFDYDGYFDSIDISVQELGIDTSEFVVYSSSPDDDLNADGSTPKIYNFKAYLVAISGEEYKE